MLAVKYGFWEPRTVSMIARAVAASAVVLASAACSETTAVAESDLTADESIPLLDEGTEVRLSLRPGLEQTLSLRPVRLHPGDELHIRSVVRNVSNTYQKGEALVCQLEIRTNMDFDNYDKLILCFAYSMTFRLAPKDSLVLTASGRVNSRPGDYVMAVRHLLRPDIVKKVRVRVYPRLEPVTTTSVGVDGY